MHRLLIFIAVIAGLVFGLVRGYDSFTQRAIEADSPFLQYGKLLLYRHRPMTGSVIGRYETGPVYTTSHFQDGLQNGETLTYWLNGAVKERANYRAGVRDGEQSGFYMEGPRKFQRHFKNGLLHGEQIEWHLSGQVYRREFYSDGEMSDKKILFDNGDLYTNYAIRDKRLYGFDGGSLCMEPAKEEGQR